MAVHRGEVDSVGGVLIFYLIGLKQLIKHFCHIRCMVAVECIPARLVQGTSSKLIFSQTKSFFIKIDKSSWIKGILFWNGSHYPKR